MRGWLTCSLCLTGGPTLNVLREKEKSLYKCFIRLEVLLVSNGTHPTERSCQRGRAPAEVHVVLPGLWPRESCRRRLVDSNTGRSPPVHVSSLSARSHGPTPKHWFLHTVSRSCGSIDRGFRPILADTDYLLAHYGRLMLNGY